MGGKQVRLNKVVRGSKGDAERTLTNLLGRRDDGLKQRPTRVTLGEWIEEWVEKPDKVPVVSTGPADKRSKWEGRPPEAIFDDLGEEG